VAEIIIKGLQKKFGDFTAVHASSFTVEDGEFFMLLGPSGCGKTTTLRMIAGLELPSAGEIYIGGEEVSRKPASERDIAFVFQMFALYPHMNVRRNLTYPLVSQGMSRRDIKAKLAEVVDILGIHDILNKSVGGLSGGDRQRVALGRAIVRDPMAFMMDEPLGALDAEFRERMAEELRALHNRMNATTVYVTHDQLEAMQMGDKIVVMNHGVVEQFGTPQDIYDKPATLFVADFIGSPAMNLLPFNGTVEPGQTTARLGGKVVAVPRQQDSAQGDLVFGVRPEHVSLSDRGVLRGEILATEYLGTSQIVSIESAFGITRSRQSSSTHFAVGDSVGMSFQASNITLFDKQSGRALRSSLNAEVLSGG